MGAITRYFKTMNIITKFYDNPYHDKTFHIIQIIRSQCLKPDLEFSQDTTPDLEFSLNIYLLFSNESHDELDLNETRQTPASA